MTLTRDTNQAVYQIRGFSPGFLQINEQLFTHSVILGPHFLKDWRPQHFFELCADDFEVFLKMKPMVLLIGTGEHLKFPPLGFYAPLLAAGIGVEVMDTSAASRTYNVLTAENREVIAALILK